MAGESLADLRGGTYILILHLPHDQDIQIGKLGRYEFRSGFYAYVGSALGRGGLAVRLKHHYNPTPRPHWHIDYLRKMTKLDQVWLAESEKVWEHDWAAILPKLYGTTLSMRGFGSSDCKCKTHLFYFQKRPLIRSFQNLVREKCKMTSGQAN